MTMWSSVSNLKESLNKIALDVHDDDDDEIFSPPIRDRLENNGNNNHYSSEQRRLSRNFPVTSNGFNISPSNHQIEQYKTEIKRLQDSEAEIKALSVNYAALLKEKEDQVSRLAEENGSLKQNLRTTHAALSASKAVTKGGGDLSPSRQKKVAVKARTVGSPQTNGSLPKQDGFSNGTIAANGKEFTDIMGDKSRSFAAIQATNEAQMKQMVMELDKGRDRLADMQIRLQEEQKLNGSFQQELRSLKDENGKMLKEIHKMRDELIKKTSDAQRLQIELHRRGTEEKVDSMEKLKNVIALLELENSNIKKEKDELEAALKSIRSSPVHKDKEKDELEAALKSIRSSPVHKDIPGQVDLPNEHSGRMNEAFPGKDEMEKSLQKLEKDFKEAVRRKDKALQELNRLKQHLLEKESEESEKMDEDSTIIEKLREVNEHQRVQISRLDYALKQAIRDQEEIKVVNSNELNKSKEIIDELNRKLTSCMTTIDAKNIEVLNLQTALGQYYAEIEAKERLAEELSVAKEKLARLSKQLKEAQQQVEAVYREKDEVEGKLSHAERMLAEGNNRVKKVEEDNEKLRRALEQSMTRLNRMSVDSDFLVDRRIVIKLLVTYFQRNHSKEVLDLMVRMLGFSEEDKQRIGAAQQQGTGKGVVRGVFGLPGRLVGGILGSGGSSDPSIHIASDNQSFADLWVDFLLTETEREKREAMEAAAANNASPKPNLDQYKDKTPNTIPPWQNNYSSTTPPLPNTASRPNSNTYLYQNQIPPPSSSFLQAKHSDSEFSTVPLSSSAGSLQGSRPFSR